MGRLQQKMAQGMENASVVWLQHLQPQQDSPPYLHLSLYPEMPVTWEGSWFFSVLFFCGEEKTFCCGRVQKCSLMPVPPSCCRVQ